MYTELHPQNCILVLLIIYRGNLQQSKFQPAHVSMANTRPVAFVAAVDKFASTNERAQSKNAEQWSII